MCRKVDGNSFDEARTMLVQGASTLNKHGKHMEAADLGDMLLKTILEEKKQPMTEAAVEAIETIAASFPSPPPPAALTFIRAAARWADHSLVEGPSGAGVPVEDMPDIAPDAPHAMRRARVHALAAKTLAAAGAECRQDAQRHFIESYSPVNFAAFLWSWAQAGYAGETDLFLARAVLQLLCLGNLRDANALRNEYYRLAGADPAAAAGSIGNPRLDTPLCHFVRFLLLTLEVRHHRMTVHDKDDKYTLYLIRMMCLFPHVCSEKQGLCSRHW